jgi:hypothetical protein
MFRVFAATFVLLLSACEKPENTAKAPTAAAVRAAMAEMFAYSEKTFAILRAHRKDCDAAAARLAERAPVFRELGPRIMAVKSQMAALPEPERDALKREAEQEAERFRARVPDLEELERIARECEKSSSNFATIAPQVMFVKKK